MTLNLYGAPDPLVPVIDPEKPTPTQATPVEMQRARQLELAKVPTDQPVQNQEKPKDVFFLGTRRMISLQLGSNYSFIHSESLPSITGFSYTHLQSSTTGLAAGADLVSDGTGVIVFDVKHLLSRERLRPYYLLGGAVRVLPNEALLTFLRLTNWQLRSGLGIEYSFDASLSVFLQSIGVVAVNDLAIQGKFGLGWSW